MVYTHPAHEGGKLRRSGRENERIKEAEEQEERGKDIKRWNLTGRTYACM